MQKNNWLVENNCDLIYIERSQARDPLVTDPFNLKILVCDANVFKRNINLIVALFFCAMYIPAVDYCFK